MLRETVGGTARSEVLTRLLNLLYNMLIMHIVTHMSIILVNMTTVYVFPLSSQNPKQKHLIYTCQNSQNQLATSIIQHLTGGNNLEIIPAANARTNFVIRHGSPIMTRVLLKTQNEALYVSYIHISLYHTILLYK